MPKVENKTREIVMGRGSLLKNELREDLEVCENYINDVPNILDPCKLCANWDEKTCYNEDCRECCWYYASKFRLKERKGQEIVLYREDADKAYSLLRSKIGEIMSKED